MLAIKDDKHIRRIFFNKINFGKYIFSLCKLNESKRHTIKFTMTEDKIIPTTPKLYGEKFPKFLTGAPIKIQSKNIFISIPANDN